jgi:transcriptional regulator with XRE-family HTH domain
MDDNLPPPPHPFAAHLRQKRVIAGLSQKKLARISGVSEGWIRLLERGHQTTKDQRVYATRPKPETTVRLATVLDWDVREALTVAGHDPDVIPEVEMPSLENRIGRLTQSEVAIVERILAALHQPTPAS